MPAVGGGAQLAIGRVGFSIDERLRLALCAALALLGLAVIAGWLLEVEALKSIAPGLATMKFNTALGFVLTGAGLAWAPYRRLRWPAVAAGLALLVLGTLTFAEYAFNIDLGIDELVFRDRGTLTGSGHPGRMSLLTAAAYSALGPAIMLLGLGRSRKPIIIGHGLASVSALISILAASGYAFGAQAYGWIGFYTSIAVHAAVGLMVASAAALMTRSNEGWLRPYADSPAAREVLVRLLPLALALPVATGLLILLGAGLRLYNAPYGLTLFIPTMAAALVAGSLWVASRLRESEAIRRRHERHLELLVAELNHRVKNTLSVVQSFAHQSFRSAPSTAEGVAAFEGRLTALAQTHNLLTDQNWDHVSLRELVRTCLTPGDEPSRFSVEGPDMPVSPKSAVTLAMTLHELATNSMKYGALSKPEGRVQLRWSRDDSHFRFAWTDCDGPPVVPPSRRGFGSRMLERALAAELGGKARIRYEPTGLVYEVEAPARDEL
jgi:two-component sensor histidine kinase